MRGETDRPLSCLFGILKPSGPTSMELLDRLKPLLASSDLFYAPHTPKQVKPSKRLKPWERELLQRCGRLPPKMGQGGTLDPLAEGVLVIGIHHGTKQLQQFLHCTKEYETTGLLGTATTSYDCKDPVMKRAPYAHVTEDMLRAKLHLFRGSVQQLPPLFSALRMDGKRLFEYAREGLPLPRPIEPRNVTVEELELVAWLPGASHSYMPPDREVSDDEKVLVSHVRELAGSEANGLDTMRSDQNADKMCTDQAGPNAISHANGSTNTQAHAPAADTKDPINPENVAAPADPENCADIRNTSLGPPAFSLKMTVSSGTYVRSIVHDLGTACGSAAHVVKLVRTRQGAFHTGNCIPWSVFERGLEELAAPTNTQTIGNQGLREWERMILEHMQQCD